MFGFSGLFCTLQITKPSQKKLGFFAFSGAKSRIKPLKANEFTLPSLIVKIKENVAIGFCPMTLLSSLVVLLVPEIDTLKMQFEDITHEYIRGATCATAELNNCSLKPLSLHHAKTVPTKYEPTLFSSYDGVIQPLQQNSHHRELCLRVRPLWSMQTEYS